MMARIGAITASFMMMWLVQKYDKSIVVYPFATLAVAAACVVLFFLHETAGLKFHETIEESERWTHKYEMEPLSQKDSNPIDAEGGNKSE